MVKKIRDIVDYFSELVEKLDKKRYYLYVRRKFGFYFGGKIVIDDDKRISIYSDDDHGSHVFIRKDMLDENGELIFDFKEVDRFYADGLPFTSSKGFPDKTKVIMINDSPTLEHVELKYAESIHFNGTNLKSLRVNETSDEGTLSLVGDVSNFDSFAYLPINSFIYSCEPFKELTESCKDPVKQYQAFKDAPRDPIYIEYFFLSTKKEINGLKESRFADPNHYFSTLYNMMISDKKIFGTYEPYKFYKDFIRWPEDFFTEDMNKAVKSIVKFNL